MKDEATAKAVIWAVFFLTMGALFAIAVLDLRPQIVELIKEYDYFYMEPWAEYTATALLLGFLFLVLWAGIRNERDVRAKRTAAQD